MKEKQYGKCHEGYEEMPVKRYRLFVFAIMLLSVGQFFSIPLSTSSPSFDYSLLLQNDEFQLVPGKNITITLFVNQSGNSTGIVSLQGNWVETG